MRIMIKGGVWKNTEDEILKAAVMKYGLNQWGRISSLLVRKSAKQCKARWYEWLDPAIKKTEWTREEDEKLLHLAKLMPTQWRTIAPIVGRTPAQCLDRYEKLLDMALNKDEKYDPADDPRRLRPGEIDPFPETKPARPDPVDMDDDEKEMLSEARARLANTRGKKAKRKAREKQLEEARRLAALQKKRELKAAGIEVRERYKNKRSIDYGSEVVFEKKPAPGFYDTGAEGAATKAISQEFRPVTLEELEGKRRKDVEEALIKRDIKRQKVSEAHDAPGALALANQANELQMVRRRTKMMLPSPQVSDVELEQIARLGEEAGLADEVAEGAGGDATRQLLGNYAQTPARFATPMRTPRTAAGGGMDRLMQEAQNLARMQNMQTPLLGGENPELHASDYSGVTPKPMMAATPNPLAAAATPGRGGLTQALTVVAATPSVAGTPSRGAALGPGATPGATPLRDELGLNDADSLAMAGTARQDRARQALLKSELRAGLGSLPKPQNEYEVAVPELPQEEETGEETIEEDAAETKARRLREEEARRAAEERKKSQALQRGLPRPTSLAQLSDVRPGGAAAGLRERAEQLLVQELVVLLQHDNDKYPIKRSKKDKGKQQAVSAPRTPPLPQLPEQHLQEARLLLEEELETVRSGMGHTDVPLEEYLEVWGAARRDVIWIPSQQRYGRAASATNSDRLDSIKAEYDTAYGEMKGLAERAAKLEGKAKLVVAGLQGRADKVGGEAEGCWQQLQDSGTEEACFKALQEREVVAAQERLQAMRALVEQQRQREVLLQERYKALVQERGDLQAAAQQQQQQQVAVQ